MDSIYTLILLTNDGCKVKLLQNKYYDDLLSIVKTFAESDEFNKINYLFFVDNINISHSYVANLSTDDLGLIVCDLEVAIPKMNIIKKIQIIHNNFIHGLINETDTKFCEFPDIDEFIEFMDKHEFNKKELLDSEYISESTSNYFEYFEYSYYENLGDIQKELLIDKLTECYIAYKI